MFNAVNDFFLAHGAMVAVVWVMVFSLSTILMLHLVPGLSAWHRNCYPISASVFESIIAVEAGLWLSAIFWPVVAGWLVVLTVISFVPCYYFCKHIVRKYSNWLPVQPAWRVLSGTKFRDTYGNPQ